MLIQRIKKISDYRYSIFYQQDLGRLLIDFEPLIKQFQLSGDFALIHWQARPRGQRRWGIFTCDPGGCNYQSFEAYRAEGLPCEGVQLDEAKAVTVPTAVIVYKGVRVLDRGDFAEIVKR